MSCLLFLGFAIDTRTGEGAEQHLATSDRSRCLASVKKRYKSLFSLREEVLPILGHFNFRIEPVADASFGGGRTRPLPPAATPLGTQISTSSSPLSSFYPLF